MSTRQRVEASPPADPSLDDQDRWLNAAEAGKHLGYSAWSIREFAKRRLIKFAKGPGRSCGYRFRRQWLDDFLESRAVEAKTSSLLVDYRQAKQSREQPRLSIADVDPELAKAVARAKAARERGR